MTHTFDNKTPGGFRLTYTTLASTLKYPCESFGIDPEQKMKHRKKYNFFQTDRKIFQEVCQITNMQLEKNDPLIYKRHPFSFLTEAADDICYRLIDMEDAHRLGIISTPNIEEKLIALIKCMTDTFASKLYKDLHGIEIATQY